MRKVDKYSGLSLVDIATQEHGGIDGIVALAKLNGLNIDATLAAPSTITIDEEVENVVRSLPKLFPVKPVPAENQTIVQNGQNIADLCIQEYGSIEGILSLLRLNGLTPNSDPITNALLKADVAHVVKSDVRNYFKTRNYYINTGIPAPNGILTETGFNILTETGDAILTE